MTELDDACDRALDSLRGADGRLISEVLGLAGLLEIRRLLRSRDLGEAAARLQKLSGIQRAKIWGRLSPAGRRVLDDLRRAPSMTIKHVTTNADGTIPGLRVVGYHGRLGPSQTPARRPPVYADEDALPVRIRESEPESVTGSGGGFSLKLDCGARPIPAEVWDSTGTRIEPPWPATLAAPMMLILGERELRVVPELRRVVPADEPEQERESVAALLRWIETETPRSDTLRCVRIGELLAWNCTRALANALCARVAIIARGQVMDAAREGSLHELRRASFWLSRAALRDVDMVLAVAGLRRAGFERWQELLHAGVQNSTEARRLALVDEADGDLPTSGPAYAEAQELNPLLELP